MFAKDTNQYILSKSCLASNYILNNYLSLFDDFGNEHISNN